MLKQELFDCKIQTFAQEILHRKVLSVQISTAEDGMITILPHHENIRFFLQPGKMIVTARDNIREYYYGFGSVGMHDDVLAITAAPIYTPAEYAKNKSKLHELGDIGDNLIAIYDKFE